MEDITAGENPLDRSLAFTALLEWPEFGGLTTRLGELIVTELVTIYREHHLPDHPQTTLWDVYLLYRQVIGEGSLAAHAARLEGLPAA